MSDRYSSIDDLPEDAWLLRRISPDGVDEREGRPQSGQFALRKSKNEEGLSFYIESEVPARTVMYGHERFKLVRMQWRFLRDEGFEARRVPDPSDQIPERSQSHIVLYYQGVPGLNVPKLVRTRLAREAGQNWVDAF